MSSEDSDRPSYHDLLDFDPPGYDDRKELADVFQEKFTLPEGVELKDIYGALIDVAIWGYRRRWEQTKPWPWKKED